MRKMGIVSEVSVFFRMYLWIYGSMYVFIYGSMDLRMFYRKGEFRVWDFIFAYVCMFLVFFIVLCSSWFDVVVCGERCQLRAKCSFS